MPVEITADNKSFVALKNGVLRFRATADGRPAGPMILHPGGAHFAALSRDGQKQLVKEATGIVATLSGDPTQADRTWVILTEAAEGGWGMLGTAFGKEEFAALVAKARAAG